MACINAVSESFIDSILPVYGQSRECDLIWDEGRHMFIVDEYESQAGNRSYKGVRIADRFTIVEYIGNYHTQCYINAVEVYSFDGRESHLIARKEFPKTRYSADLVRETTERMMSDYIKSQLMLQRKPVQASVIESQSKTLIDSSYRSLLNNQNLQMVQSAVRLLKK